MNQTVASIVVIVCIFATFGTTYAVVNANKDQEITELKVQYELDIYNLNNRMNNLTSQLLQYVGDEDMFVGSWNRSLGDKHRYYDTMYLYSNKTARLKYTGSASMGVTYSIKNGKLVFDQHGQSVREFSYSFHNDHMLVVTELEEYTGSAIYRKS